MEDRQTKYSAILDHLEELEKNLRREIEDEMQKRYDKQLEEEKKKYEEKLEIVKEETAMKIRQNILNLFDGYEKTFDEAAKEETASVEKNEVNKIKEKTDILLPLHHEKPVDEATKEEDVSVRKTMDIEEKLPPMLQPINESFLQDIANKLEPESFMNLVQSSKKMWSLAKLGMLQVPVQLDCRTFIHYNSPSTFHRNEEKSVGLMFRNKPISLKQLNSLRFMKCWRPKINALNLGNFPKCGERVRELLDYIHVKDIDDGNFEMEHDPEDLIKRYNFKVLSFRNLTSSNFLLSPFINRITDLHLHFDGSYDVSVITQFLKSSSNREISFYSALPRSFAPDLLQDWLKGQMRFQYVSFIVEDEVPFSHQMYRELRTLLSDMSDERFVDDEIYELYPPDVKEIVNPLVPCHIVGDEDGCMIVVRSDLTMLKVGTFSSTIVMEKIY